MIMMSIKRRTGTVAPSDAQMTQATVRKNATSDRSFCQNSFRYRSIVCILCEGGESRDVENVQLFRVLVGKGEDARGERIRTGINSLLIKGLVLFTLSLSLSLSLCVCVCLSLLLLLGMCLSRFTSSSFSSFRPPRPSCSRLATRCNSTRWNSTTCTKPACSRARRQS